MRSRFRTDDGDERIRWCVVSHGEQVIHGPACPTKGEAWKGLYKEVETKLLELLPKAWDDNPAADMNPRWPPKSEDERVGILERMTARLGHVSRRGG
jgi:hypothetical protein